MENFRYADHNFRYHGPATSKRSFRGELEPRQEPSVSLEAGSSPPGETKCVFRGQKRKSKQRLERNAERLKSYMQRMVPLGGPDCESSAGEALTFLAAVIRGWKKRGADWAEEDQKREVFSG
jgi:hypothetical protein